MKPKHLLLAALMSIIFGMGWVLAKAALDHFPPILLAAFRFAVAAIVLIWFVKPPFGQMRNIMLISALAITVPYAMIYVGLKDLDASATILLVQLEAPVLIMLGALMLGEMPGYKKTIGTMIAFAGIVLIAGDPHIRSNITAVAWVLGSILTWAVGQIKIRKLGQTGGLRNLAWISAFAFPQLLLTSALLEDDQIGLILNATPAVWMTVIYLGMAMTVGGVGIWYHLIGKYPVAFVSPFLLLVPVTTIFGGVLWLDESLTRMSVIGGAIIIAGVALVIVERPTARKRLKAGKTAK
ncbi:EamA family transporter [Thalassospira sp.]|uniref:DMT family transporter n=1 Tax=Thalassospira sp. TaxID=1912094 RepID=UPI000C5492EF|nr:EamA family transporter [Thalassospira sp.]MBC05119.1 EamA family transporter [Thalassospira sp.]